MYANIHPGMSQYITIDYDYAYTYDHNVNCGVFLCNYESFVMSLFSYFYIVIFMYTLNQGCQTHFTRTTLISSPFCASLKTFTNLNPVIYFNMRKKKCVFNRTSQVFGNDKECCSRRKKVC